MPSLFFPSCSACGLCHLLTVVASLSFFSLVCLFVLPLSQVKLTIQKEVFHGAILQQMFVVEFVVQNQQCTGQLGEPATAEYCIALIPLFPFSSSSAA